MKSGIIDFFAGFYGTEPHAVGRAPGRLEVLGNHTDYNEGYVLSAAVGQKTEFAVMPVQGRKCTIHNDFSTNNTVTFNIDEIDKPIPGDWSNYIKGMIVELRKRGHSTGAFNAAILSSVPLSAGMSSSAALEMAAGFALGSVFNIEMPKDEWARAGQGVENNYIGVKTGLLDQFSSVFGCKNSLIMCDFRTVKVLKNVTLPQGYVLIVANTMVKHDLVTSDYNLRRESCERAVEALKKKYADIKALRDVSPEMLEAGKSLMAHQDYLRALHVVGENDRVLKGVAFLEKNDIIDFGKLLFESHNSSRNNFENSCPELDSLVELAATLGSSGSRLSGGGFGGITIHLVKESESESYCARLKTAYKLQTGKETETIICAIGDGASVERF